MSGIAAYDDSDKFSFCSSTIRSHSRNNSIHSGASPDYYSDDDDDNNNSLTEVVSTKNDLKAKYEAARHTKKLYEDRKKELQSKIQELNHTADVSLRLLDEKKDALTKENDRLHMILDSLPTIEFLQEQAKLLTQILESTVVSTRPSSFLDVTPLQDINILFPGESLAILPQRLQSLVNRLNSLMMSKKKHPNQLGDTEERRLTRQIKILGKSSPDSYSRTHYQCEQLEEEVEKLREEVRCLEERQDRLQTPLPISDEEISNIVLSVGGDPNRIHRVGGKFYKYENAYFTIELRFQRIYAVTKEMELPLASYIKSMVKPFVSKKRHNSLI